MKTLSLIAATFLISITTSQLKAADPAKKSQTTQVPAQTDAARKAQMAAKAEKRRAQHISTLSKELNLSSKQKEAMEKIFKDMDPKFQSLNQEFAPRRQALHKEIREKQMALNKDYRAKSGVLRQESDKRVSAILTSNQRVKWAQFKAEKQAQAKKKRAKKHHPKPPKK